MTGFLLGVLIFLVLVGIGEMIVATAEPRMERYYLWVPVARTTPRPALGCVTIVLILLMAWIGFLYVVDFIEAVRTGI